MPQKIHPSTTENHPAVGRISSSAELGSRPTQAEPVQVRLVEGQGSGLRWLEQGIAMRDREEVVTWDSKLQ